MAPLILGRCQDCQQPLLCREPKLASLWTGAGGSPHHRRRLRQISARLGLSAVPAFASLDNFARARITSKSLAASFMRLVCRVDRKTGPQPPELPTWVSQCHPAKEPAAGPRKQRQSQTWLDRVERRRPVREVHRGWLSPRTSAIPGAWKVQRARLSIAA